MVATYWLALYCMPIWMLSMLCVMHTFCVSSFSCLCNTFILFDMGHKLHLSAHRKSFMKEMCYSANTKVETKPGQSKYPGQMGYFFPSHMGHQVKWRRLDNLVYILKVATMNSHYGRIQSICQHQTVMVVHILQCCLFYRRFWKNNCWWLAS